MNALESQCVESLHRESEQWPSLPVPKEETLLTLPRPAKPVVALMFASAKPTPQKVSRGQSPATSFPTPAVLTPFIRENPQVCKVNSITEPTVYSPSHFFGQKYKKEPKNCRKQLASNGTPTFGRSLGKGLMPRTPLKFRLRSVYSRRKPAFIHSLASPMLKPRTAGLNQVPFNRR